jgi:hypothetical protein
MWTTGPERRCGGATRQLAAADAAAAGLAAVAGALFDAPASELVVEEPLEVPEPAGTVLELRESVR